MEYYIYNNKRHDPRDMRQLINIIVGKVMPMLCVPYDSTYVYITHVCIMPCFVYVNMHIQGCWLIGGDWYWKLYTYNIVYIAIFYAYINYFNHIDCINFILYYYLQLDE